MHHVEAGTAAVRLHSAVPSDQPFAHVDSRGRPRLHQLACSVVNLARGRASSHAHHCVREIGPQVPSRRFNDTFLNGTRIAICSHHEFLVVDLHLDEGTVDLVVSYDFRFNRFNDQEVAFVVDVVYGLGPKQNAR